MFPAYLLIHLQIVLGCQLRSKIECSFDEGKRKEPDFVVCSVYGCRRPLAGLVDVAEHTPSFSQSMRKSDHRGTIVYVHLAPKTLSV